MRLQTASHGARLKCCRGFGYWSMKKPLPNDKLKQRTFKVGGVCYTIYLSVLAPEGIKLTHPKESI